MFSEQINVAAIMREIKSNVIPVEESDSLMTHQAAGNENRYDQISTFLVNTRANNYIPCISVGQNVPLFSKYPRPLAVIVRFCCKVVRKFVKYIIRDQIQVNAGFDALIKALIEHDDALRQEVSELRTALDESNACILELETRLSKIDRSV